MLNKVISLFCILIIILSPFSVYSQETVGAPSTQEGQFVYIEEEEKIEIIGLTHGPVWCYDSAANAILITSATRERERCELRTQLEVEREAVKFEFEINKLQVRVDTLLKQHKEISLAKDREIEKLTSAAMDRPNKYSHWWAAGGFVSGVLVTVGAFVIFR